MTSSELRHALIDLEMRQGHFAKLIKKTDATVSQWCTGRRPIPETVALLVQNLLQNSERQNA